MSNIDAIEKGLRPTASTQTRTLALIEAGIMASVIAEVCGIGESTITKWKNEDVNPRNSEASTRLDVLRLAMSKLLFEKELEPAEAVAWLQSCTARPPYSTPLEILKDEPISVLEMIDSTTFASSE